MNKRLVKSSDKKLFGVCGGLGNYFDIDPTVVRIGFLIAFFGFGTGLLIYLILAIAMPDQ
jgi:phage shock protein C